MKENLKMFLSDDRIRETTEYVPWPEGGIMEDFLLEAKVVEDAAKRCNERKSGAVQAAFILRAFYLLGVQRGAENWRVSIAEEIEAENADNLLKPMPFVLDVGCAADAVDNFRVCHEEMEKMLARLGLRF